jgi:ADP-ribose pyrophosphatase YjhB (NUDIX family)/SAM-dependent methyltransferase
MDVTKNGPESIICSRNGVKPSHDISSISSGAIASSQTGSSAGAAGNGDRQRANLDAIERILDPHRAWRENTEQHLIRAGALYGLKELHTEERIATSQITHCARSKFFVVCALYDSDRNFFVQRDFSRDGGWELVGGHLIEGESFDQALDRIVQKEAGNVLVEAVPVAIVHNRFVADGHPAIDHLGIAYVGRLRLDHSPSQDGAFCPLKQCDVNVRDKKVLALAAKILKNKTIEPPLDEVDDHVGAGGWHFVHNWIVKPVSNIFSSRILRKAVVAASCEVGDDATRTVLDVACGDDRTVLDLAPHAQIVVANDIARASMTALVGDTTTNNIVFTNENLLELSFARTFEVVICKNVAHHMRSPEDLDRLFAKLRTLGRRIVFMDIEEPRRSARARLWNWYYRACRHDHGSLFISFDQLNELLGVAFGDCNVTSQKVSTIKGDYMLATIDVPDVAALPNN